MRKRKPIKAKGKLPLSKFFQKFTPGERVALVRELSQNADFPKRMHGKTGKVIEKRGSAYVVEVNDFNLAKKYIVKPIHLKRVGGAA